MFLLGLGEKKRRPFAVLREYLFVIRNAVYQFVLHVLKGLIGIVTGVVSQGDWRIGRGSFEKWVLNNDFSLAWKVDICLLAHSMAHQYETLRSSSDFITLLDRSISSFLSDYLLSSISLAFRVSSFCSGQAGLMEWLILEKSFTSPVLFTGLVLMNCSLIFYLT